MGLVPAEPKQAHRCPVDRDAPSLDLDLADADAQTLIVLAQTHLQRVQVRLSGRPERRVGQLDRALQAAQGLQQLDLL